MEMSDLYEVQKIVDEMTWDVIDWLM